MKDMGTNLISTANSVIYRKTQIWRTEQFADLGLTAAQIPVIVIVCRENGISQNALRERLFMDKSTVAKIVGSLIEDNYLIRTTNEKDKRAFDLMPSAKAKSAYPQILERGKVWNAILTHGMTESEQRTLEILLTKAANNARSFSKEV